MRLLEIRLERCGKLRPRANGGSEKIVESLRDAQRDGATRSRAHEGPQRAQTAYVQEIEDAAEQTVKLARAGSLNFVPTWSKRCRWTIALTLTRCESTNGSRRSFLRRNSVQQTRAAYSRLLVEDLAADATREAYRHLFRPLRTELLPERPSTSVRC
jgi:hypothetical protein